jgi:hypothetical protein
MAPLIKKRRHLSVSISDNSSESLNDPSDPNFSTKRQRLSETTELVFKNENYNNYKNHRSKRTVVD